MRSGYFWWRSSIRTTVSLAAILVAAVLTGGTAGASGSDSFHLVFDGTHNAQLLHQGTFTASLASCSSGTVADASIDEATLTATRVFTCTAGGSFTAKVGPLSAEHGGSGVWQIVSGTGPFADLRGKGTFSGVLVSGNPDDPSTIVFRSTWDGLARLDVDGPAISVTKAKAVKIRHRPAGRYTLSVGLSLVDAQGGPVTYAVQVVDSKKRSNAVFKSGTTSTGTVTWHPRFKPTKKTRYLRLTVDATDGVGNDSSPVTTKIRVR